MYDVKDENNKLLHKPWRVNTNVVRLFRPLSLCCDKAHEHGVTHGAAAVRSGYYSDALVKVIGEAITARGEVAALPEQEEEMLSMDGRSRCECPGEPLAPSEAAGEPVDADADPVD
eukprot:11444174-Heterocapsa_arctica.AAC.1